MLDVIAPNSGATKGERDNARSILSRMDAKAAAPPKQRVLSREEILDMAEVMNRAADAFNVSPEDLAAATEFFRTHPGTRRRSQNPRYQDGQRIRPRPQPQYSTDAHKGTGKTEQQERVARAYAAGQCLGDVTTWDTNMSRLMCQVHGGWWPTDQIGCDNSPTGKAKRYTPRYRDGQKFTGFVFDEAKPGETFESVRERIINGDLKGSTFEVKFDADGKVLNFKRVVP